MKKLFLSISKGEPLRFLGHLDLLRTMERAVIRSGVPVAFSEGFNPVSYTHLTLPTKLEWCRSRWSPYH